jgi:hypothetical protein
MFRAKNAKAPAREVFPDGQYSPHLVTLQRFNDVTAPKELTLIFSHKRNGYIGFLE